MIQECTNMFKKVLKKAIQKVVKGKSSQKSAQKKYSEKLVGSRVGSKKIIFSKKNAQQSFFCQKGPHKRQRSKKHSKEGIFIGNIYFFCWTRNPVLRARLNTSATPGRVLRGTSVLRRWYQLLWRVWEHYVTDRCQEWRDVIGLTQQKLRWFQNILVGKVESERPNIHGWVHECARLGDFTKFSIGLLACLGIGLVQIWILGGLEGVTTRGVVDLMKFVDRDLQLHEPLCLPIQTKFFCFAD